MPFFPRLKRFGCALVVRPGKGIGHASLAHFLQVGAHHSVPLTLVRVSLRQTAKLVVLDGHFLRELVLVIDMHLELHLVAAFHPGCKGSLLHPVVHLTQQNLPIALRCLVLRVVSLDSIKAFPELAMVQGLFQVLTAPLVPLSQDQMSMSLLPKVESLLQKSISHLFTHVICPINLIIRGFIDLGPFVKVLLEIASFHDICPSVQCTTARPINRLFLHVNLFRQVFDLCCKIASFFLHFHDHG